MVSLKWWSLKGGSSFTASHSDLCTGPGVRGDCGGMTGVFGSGRVLTRLGGGPGVGNRIPGEGSRLAA